MLDKMQSENINELAAALCKAQGEMTPAIKDSKNPFFKSSYADLSSIWSCCKEPLSKNGLAVMQTMDFKDNQNVLITTLAHASGQWVRSCLPILNEKNNAQGMGSAITYMRRYALSAIVGVICDEDDDGQGASKPATKNGNGKSEYISEIQVEEIEDMLSQCDDVYVNNVTNYYAKLGVQDWSGLTHENYQKLYKNISSKLKGKAV